MFRLKITGRIATNSFIWFLSNSGFLEQKHQQQNNSNNKSNNNSNSDNDNDNNNRNNNNIEVTLNDFWCQLGTMQADIETGNLESNVKFIRLVHKKSFIKIFNCKCRS